MPCITAEVDYKRGLSGSNFMVIQTIDAAIIADLMMGNDGSNPKTEISEMELSALGETMNVMMGSASTSMSTLFGERVEIDPPRVNERNFDDPEFVFPGDPDEAIARVSFRLVIENLVDSSIMLLIPFEFARNMAENLTKEPSVAPPPVQQAAPAPPVQPTSYSPPPSMPQMDAPSPRPAVTVQPVQFAPITPATSTRENGNIGLLMDVPLQLSVELGSTRMKIKEILELGMGSIIELDRLAGEPVDILVNGKLIAKGEVVVIDENFGVKVTDILSPVDRVNSLQ
jgi:flagellar motor switch protein FliN/FliY